jgi:hypothetical protein
VCRLILSTIFSKVCEYAAPIGYVKPLLPGFLFLMKLIHLKKVTELLGQDGYTSINATVLGGNMMQALVLIHQRSHGDQVHVAAAMVEEYEHCSSVLPCLYHLTFW